MSNDATGRMDRWIEIKEPTVTRSATGQETITYTFKTGVWAFVEWQTTELKEKEQAGFDQASSMIDFTFRWIDNITPKDIIDYNGLTYDIVAVMEEGRRDRIKVRTRLRD